MHKKLSLKWLVGEDDLKTSGLVNHGGADLAGRPCCVKKLANGGLAVTLVGEQFHQISWSQRMCNYISPLIVRGRVFSFNVLFFESACRLTPILSQDGLWISLVQHFLDSSDQ